MSDFERELFKGMGGIYDYKKGISIDTQSEYPWYHWRATEKHELIHSELILMSVFGSFQRLMLNLKGSTSIPSDHQMMYGKVWDEMRNHSFAVHEGIASYREMLWYSARTDGPEAMIAQISPEYIDAFELVSKFMPGEFASDPSLQSAYHAICNIAGVFLLDPPIFDIYADWRTLGKDELQYITRDGPDHRLQELVSRRDTVEPILRQALFDAKDIIVADLAKPENQLSPRFWSFFNNTLTALAESLPDLPTTRPSEKCGAIMKLLRKWEEDRIPIPQPFAAWLKEEGNHCPPWGTVDVGRTVLLHNFRFSSLNVRAKLADYEEYTIETPLEYIGRIAEITNSQGLAFMICVCNPSKLEIPISKGQTLPPNSILGDLFYVSLKRLKEWGLCFPNKTYMHFGSRFSVLQSVEYPLLHKFKVIRYINLAHYRMIDSSTFANSCPCIIRVTEFADFVALINAEVFDYCALWEMRPKNIMSFALVRQNRLYFYPTTFYQRYECEKMLGRQDAGSANTLSMSIGDNEHLSMVQMLALAFFGMDLGINLEPPHEVKRYEPTGQRRGGMGLVNPSPCSGGEDMGGTRTLDSDPLFKQYLKASGYTRGKWKCGRCGALYKLPRKANFKFIMCTICGFPIPNKRI